MAGKPIVLDQHVVGDYKLTVLSPDTILVRPLGDVETGLVADVARLDRRFGSISYTFPTRIPAEVSRKVQALFRGGARLAKCS